MKPYRIVAEDDHHLAIHHDGEARPFRVAKMGLSAPALARIRKFAFGGEVEAEKPAETPPAAAAPPEPTAAPVPQAEAPDAGSIPSAGYRPDTGELAFRGPAGEKTWLSPEGVRQAKDAGLLHPDGSVDITPTGEVAHPQEEAPRRKSYVEDVLSAPTVASGAARAVMPAVNAINRATEPGPEGPPREPSVADVRQAGGREGTTLGDVWNKAKDILRAPAALNEGARRQVAAEAALRAKGLNQLAGALNSSAVTPDELVRSGVLTSAEIGIGPTTSAGPVPQPNAPPPAEARASPPTRPAVAAPPPRARPVPGAATQPAAPVAPAKPDELAMAEEQIRHGIRQKAGTEADLATRRMAIQDQYMAERQKLADDGKAKMDALAARTEALRQNILSSKVDPNAHWNSLSTAGKVGSVISMILGGFGTSGGKNLAVDVFNNQVDRDVDAQKANLGIKQSILGNYMQEGHDLQAATQLAKADKLDMAAAQLEREASRAAGPTAAANAQVVLGQLRQQSMQLRQESVTKDLQNRMAALGVRAGEAQLAAMAAAKRQMKSAAANGDSPYIAMARQDIMSDPKKRAEHVVQIPTRVVMGPDKQGSPMTTLQSFGALAISPDDAKEVKKSMVGYQKLTKKLDGLDAFAKAHPHGALSPAERTKAEAMLTDFAIDFGKNEEQLGSLTGDELGLLHSIVKNPAEVLPALLGQTGASFSKLRHILESGREATLANRTLPEPWMDRYRYRPEQ